MLNIGILGADFTSENLGVQALAFSQVNLLEEALVQIDVPHSYIVISFLQGDFEGRRLQDVLGIVPDVSVESVGISLKDGNKRRRLVRAIADCDLVVGLTGGDSFSDIYGMKRLINNMACFLICENRATPYLLAPQTYGPFSHASAKLIAGHVLKKADMVFSRDVQSAEEVMSLGVARAEVVTDVAFSLPYRPAAPAQGGVTRKVGFNVSGLLWSGGYSGGNQFGLRADYQAFARGVVGALLECPDIEIELVGHVFAKDYDSPENDLKACEELAGEFGHGRVAVCEPFDNPVQAKSRICNYDAFMGSRMHATIAAFSSGVPTLPLAYSKKFDGLFGSLGYGATLDLRSVSTEDSIEAAVAFAKDPSPYADDHERAMRRAGSLVSSYEHALSGVLNELGGR